MMARQPDGDERLVAQSCSVVTTGDRVYVKELAEYLGHPLVLVRRYLRQRRLMHKVSRGSSYPPIAYVTEATALRVIAHFRAIQGEQYLQGKDFHARLERERAARRRLYARLRAKEAVRSAKEREDGE